MPCGPVGRPHEQRVPEVARRPRLAHHRDRERRPAESVGGAAGKADDTPQPLLDQRQALPGKLPGGSGRLVEEGAGAVVDSCDHVRLRAQPRGHGPVGARELEQRDLGRAERRADIGVERRAKAQVPAGPEDPLHADALGDPDRGGVAGLGERLAGGDPALEPGVVVGDPLDPFGGAEGHGDGLVRHRRVERQAASKRGQVDEWLHHRAGLPERAGHAVVVGVAAGAKVVELPSPRLGQDRRVGVGQHHHRALDEPPGPGMPLLVASEAVLEGLVDDSLHPLIDRGAHAYPALEQVLDREERAAVPLDLVQHVVDRRGRLGLRRLRRTTPIGSAWHRRARSSAMYPLRAIRARIWLRRSRGRGLPVAGA